MRYKTSSTTGFTDWMMSNKISKKEAKQLCVAITIPIFGNEHKMLKKLERKTFVKRYWCID